MSVLPSPKDSSFLRPNFTQAYALQGCRGYGDSHGYGYGMGMGIKIQSPRQP